MSVDIPRQFHDKAFREAWLSREIRTTLAQQIRALRESRAWTQEELGQRLGIDQATISRWEDPAYGRYSIRTLCRIAAVFDVGLTIRFATWSAVLTASGVWPLVPPSFEAEALPAAPDRQLAEGGDGR